MDFDKTLEEFKATSQQALVAATSVAVVSVYLLQRAGDIFVFGLDPLSPNPQLEQFGLKFSYVTMSIAWPIVLAILCAAFRVLVARRTKLLTVLQPTDVTADVEADLFSLLSSLRGSTRLLVRIIGLLPIFGLMAMVLPQAFIWITYKSPYSVYEFGAGRSMLHPTVWLAVNLGFQAIGVGLSIGPVLDFRRVWWGVLANQPTQSASNPRLQRTADAAR